MPKLSDSPLSQMDQEMLELDTFWDDLKDKAGNKRPCEFSKEDWEAYEAMQGNEPA